MILPGIQRKCYKLLSINWGGLTLYKETSAIIFWYPRSVDWEIFRDQTTLAPAGSRQLAQCEPQRHHNDRHAMLQQTRFSWKRISLRQAKTASYVGMCARKFCIRVCFEWIICLNLFQAVQIIADVRIRDP